MKAINKLFFIHWILIVVKTNEPPAKGLDDYFRKTKTKPAIYWLPLTDEEVTNFVSQ
jgi:hypothetical protein